MSSDNELIRLEKHIEKLLAGYSELKKEKRSVEQKLAELQTQYVEVQEDSKKMKKELDSLDSERGVMRDRVNRLIGQIEQWESEIDEDTQGGGSDTEASDEDEPEAESEDEEPPAGKKSRGDAGAKAQKNLFSG